MTFFTRICMFCLCNLLIINSRLYILSSNSYSSTLLWLRNCTKCRMNEKENLTLPPPKSETARWVLSAWTCQQLFPLLTPHPPPAPSPPSEGMGQVFLVIIFHHIPTLSPINTPAHAANIPYLSHTFSYKFITANQLIFYAFNIHPYTTH